MAFDGTGLRDLYSGNVCILLEVKHLSCYDYRIGVVVD